MASSPSSTLSSILGQASQWAAENVPYVWGGVSQFGADCSGMVQTIFANAGISLPRTSQEQASAGTAVANLSSATPGDLLFYDYEGPNSHVAIYAGNGMQYAETQPGQGAVEQPVDTANLEGIRNVIPGNTGGPTQTTGYTEGEWASQLLSDLGVNPDEQSVSNIEAWMTAEEPSSDWWDRNNPLNASTGTSSVNGTGSYASLSQGAQETAAELGGSNYDGILQALDLSTPNFIAFLNSTPWAQQKYPTTVTAPTSAPTAPTSAGTPTATDESIWSDVSGIPGDIVGGAGDAVLGPLISWFDAYAIRALLVVVGVVCILLALTGLTRGSGSSSPAPAPAGPSPSQAHPAEGVEDPGVEDVEGPEDVPEDVAE